MTKTVARLGIVTWHSSSYVDRCLSLLPAALGDLDAEVVVVDNASRDDSADVARRHGVKVIENHANVGYARAMNQALAGSSVDVLIALNPDTEPPARSLETLVTRLLADRDLALVAPRLVRPGGAPQSSAYRFPSVASALVWGVTPRSRHETAFGRRWALDAGSSVRDPRDVDWVVGAVHCIRAAAIDRAAPYSERWFMYAEDLDLCWRLHRGGWRVRLEADVTVPHVGNASGQLAWGGPGSSRWLGAMYDWYARTHGPRRARAWAAANLLATTLQVGELGMSSIVARAPTRQHRRAEALDRLRWLPDHARALVGRLPPPVSAASGLP